MFEVCEFRTAVSTELLCPVSLESRDHVATIRPQRDATFCSFEGTRQQQLQFSDQHSSLRPAAQTTALVPFCPRKFLYDLRRCVKSCSPCKFSKRRWHLPKPPQQEGQSQRLHRDGTHGRESLLQSTPPGELATSGMLPMKRCTKLSSCGQLAIPKSLMFAFRIQRTCRPDKQ